MNNQKTPPRPPDIVLPVGQPILGDKRSLPGR